MDDAHLRLAAPLFRNLHDLPCCLATRKWRGGKPGTRKGDEGSGGVGVGGRFTCVDTFRFGRATVAPLETPAFGFACIRGHGGGHQTLLRTQGVCFEIGTDAL